MMTLRKKLTSFFFLFIFMISISYGLNVTESFENLDIYLSADNFGQCEASEFNLTNSSTHRTFACTRQVGNGLIVYQENSTTIDESSLSLRINGASNTNYVYHLIQITDFCPEGNTCYIKNNVTKISFDYKCLASIDRTYIAGMKAVPFVSPNDYNYTWYKEIYNSYTSCNSTFKHYEYNMSTTTFNETDTFIFYLRYDPSLGNAVTYLDNIKIENIGIFEDNTLPYGNFSVNTSYCYNNSAPEYNDLITYTPILEFTDNDNDDIYVKINPTQYQDYDIDKEIIFVADKTEPSADNVNFNFLNDDLLSLRNDTNACYSYICNAQWFAGYFDTILNDNYLAWHDDPSLFYRYSLASGYGTDWIYTLDSLTENSGLNYKFIIPSYPIKFDYVLYSNLAETTLNYTFYQTDATNLLIYNNSVLVYNGTVPYNTLLYMSIDFDDNTNLITSTISNMSNTIGDETIDTTLKVINNSYPDYTYINAFRFVTPRLTDNIKKFWALNSFSIYTEKSFNQSDWVNINDVTDITANIWEPNFILYVTDSVHKDSNEYDIYKTTYVVKECTDEMVMPPDYVPETDDFRPDLAIYELLSPRMKNYFVSLGKLGLAHSVLWYIWLILFIGFAIGEFYILRQVTLTTPLVSASGICLILAILIGSLTHIITFILALVFGLAFPFTNMFAGER